jgi:hypothetical protein
MSEENVFLKSIKSIADGSNKVSTWSLSIIGGTVLVIIGNSHYQPKEIGFKLTYFLFIIGWIFIAMSMYHGLNISGRVMAAELFSKKEDELKPIFSKANDDFANQLKYFKYSLIVFGIWLVIYLLWWMFKYVPEVKS